MQPTRPPSGSDTLSNDQRPFWSEMECLALRGMDRPESLTFDEVSTISRLAFVALGWGEKRSGRPYRPSEAEQARAFGAI